MSEKHKYKVGEHVAWCNAWSDKPEVRTIEHITPKGFIRLKGDAGLYTSNGWQKRTYERGFGRRANFSPLTPEIYQGILRRRSIALIKAAELDTMDTPTLEAIAQIIKAATAVKPAEQPKDHHAK